MAALQSIRKHGILLIAIIGLALFAFIAGDLFKSCESIFGMNRSVVGKVFGEKLNYNDFIEEVNDASEMMKMQKMMQTGDDNLTEDEQQQIRESVWSQYVQNKLIEHEAEKLGLSVSNEELQTAIAKGEASSLQRLGQILDPQSGRFDYATLQNFFKQAKKMQGTEAAPGQQEQVDMLTRIWKYTERSLRYELLAQKYQALLFGSFISNDVATQQYLADVNNSKKVLVASIPAASFTDVKASEDDVKAVSDLYKEVMLQPQETRDIKYVDVEVVPSAADSAALKSKMEETYQQVLSGEDLAAVVNAANSTKRYINAPVTKAAFPSDIAALLDTIAVGSTTRPYFNQTDNTYNIVRLVSRQQMSDSIQVCRVQPILKQGEGEEKLAARADSILNALKGGANFKSIAQKYGQPGDTTWLTSEMYQQGLEDETNAKFFTLLNTAAIGEYQKFEVDGGCEIFQVVNRKSPVTKYNAAVVKVPLDYSNDTYNAEINKFNRFLAASKTLADVEKNAPKYEYNVREMKGFRSNSYRIAQIDDTKEAIKWIFDEAEEGDLSRLYECGQQHHLLLVAVTGIHEAGCDVENPQYQQYVTAVANGRAKSEAAYKKLAGVKTIAEAQKKGAEVDTINVQFYNTPLVPKVGAAEPAISGAVAKLKPGQTAVVKGSNGAYVVQVLSAEKNEQQRDAKSVSNDVVGMQMQMAGLMEQSMYGMAPSMNGINNVLYRKAKVVDNRYKF